MARKPTHPLDTSWLTHAENATVTEVLGQYDLTPEQRAAFWIAIERRARRGGRFHPYMNAHHIAACVQRGANPDA